MITLITGTPGTGKTAWLISELFVLRKIDSNREIFIHGIRNFIGFAHETIFCKSQLCDICREQTLPDEAKFVENWHEWKPSGALIVVDEVQRIWRPAQGASALLPSISALETHRHYGLDFWLISQGPHLFHNFIRLLVGRHIHLVSKWNGRIQYEWPECKQDLSSRSDAIVRPYKLPAFVFKHYQSAEIHTKQDKRKPLVVYSFLFIIPLLIIALYFGYQSIKAHKSIEVAGGTAQAVTPATKIASSSFPDFEPQIQGVPESAPAYSPLIKVVDAPILVGCIYSASRDVCNCFTGQSTPYPTTKSYCMEQVVSHRFNPYLKPRIIDKSHDDIVTFKNEILEK